MIDAKGYIQSLFREWIVDKAISSNDKGEMSSAVPIRQKPNLIDPGWEDEFEKNMNPPPNEQSIKNLVDIFKNVGFVKFADLKDDYIEYLFYGLMKRLQKMGVNFKKQSFKFGSMVVYNPEVPDIKNILKHTIKEELEIDPDYFENGSEEIFKKPAETDFGKILKTFNEEGFYKFNLSDHKVHELIDYLDKNNMQYGETSQLGSDITVFNPKSNNIPHSWKHLNETLKHLNEDYVDATGNIKTLSNDETLNSNIDTWLDKVQKHSDATFQKDYSKMWEIGHAPKFRKVIGTSWIKILEEAPGRKSMFCFIDVNGNIFKPASYNAPAKGVRGNVSAPNPPLTSGDMYRQMRI